LPYWQETVSRIAELNRGACFHASGVVQYYENQIVNAAMQNGSSFINKPQPLCDRQNDYQYYEFSL
jgi:hypothetical protein